MRMSREISKSIKIGARLRTEMNYRALILLQLLAKMAAHDWVDNTLHVVPASHPVADYPCLTAFNGMASKKELVSRFARDSAMRGTYRVELWDGQPIGPSVPALGFQIDDDEHSFKLHAGNLEPWRRVDGTLAVFNRHQKIRDSLGDTRGVFYWDSPSSGWFVSEGDTASYEFQVDSSMNFSLSGHVSGAANPRHCRFGPEVFGFEDPWPRRSRSFPPPRRPPSRWTPLPLSQKTTRYGEDRTAIYVRTHGPGHREEDVYANKNSYARFFLLPEDVAAERVGVKVSYKDDYGAEHFFRGELYGVSEREFMGGKAPRPGNMGETNLVVMYFHDG